MSLINNLVGKFEGEKTFKFSELNAFAPDSAWISSGSPSFDFHTKTLGLPVGIVEVRGESQSGKTTFTLQAMMSCMRQYKDRAVVTILSSERRDNKVYAKQIGVKTDQIIVHKVATIEDTFHKIYNTVKMANEALLTMFREDAKTEKIKVDTPAYKEYVEKRKEEYGKLRFLFVWDALGQTVSAQELAKAKLNAEKGEAKQAALGSASRSLASGFRSFVGLTDEEDITLLVVNRPYDKVDGQPGKKSYGGKAITLYPCLRLELARTEGLKVSEREVGQKTKITLIKSDFSRPKSWYKVEIGYGLGFILGAEDIELGIKWGILEKHGRAGAKFKMGKKSLTWGSRKELYKLYDEKEPMLKILLSKLTKEAHKRVLEFREQEAAK
jgi:RecA/RadA recombinase